MKDTFDLSYIFDENSALLKEYEDILPLILLINYRVHSIRGTEGLYFGDDGFQKDWSFVHWMRYFSSFPFFYLKKNKGKRNAEANRVLLSDTFLLTDRYDDAMEILLTNENVIGILGSNTCNVAAYFEGKKSTGIKRQKYDALQLPIGLSTAGFRLKNTAYDLYLFLEELAKEGKHADEYPEKTRKLFDKLRKDGLSRVNKIRKVLVKYGIKQFITVNEFNLKDLLIIMAMKTIPGTISKYYSHFLLFADISAIETESEFRFCDKSYYWSGADVDFVNKYVNYAKDYSRFPSDFCGTPELVLTDEILQRDECERANKVVFFTPSDVGDVGCNVPPVVGEFRREIFEKLKCFADLNDVQIILRHKPDELRKNPELDREYMDEFGFGSADESSQQLREELMNSVAAIGCATSAEYLAMAMGCETFCLMIYDLHLSENLDGIKKVELDELPNLILDKDKRYIKQDLFFNQDKLLDINFADEI